MKGIAVIKLPIGLISTCPCSFLHFHGKTTAFYRLKRGNGWQGIEQSHQLWEVNDLASSPALSLSSPCLYPQLSTRPISGTLSKACGCGQEQLATVLLSCRWSFHFLQQTPAGDEVLSFTLLFWTNHLQRPQTPGLSLTFAVQLLLWMARLLIGTWSQPNGKKNSKSQFPGP